MSSVSWNLPFVINLGNSIIGVVILAIPFCFQQCGIILGSLTLLFCTWLTLVSCQLLIKAGVTSRRGSYAFLAYHTHGATGKVIVELSMIGLQLGTLVAQVVIIGDLGPAIVSKWTGLENNSSLRTGLIVFLCLFVGLPLGLLKNLRSLSSTSTMCILFYTVFVFYVVSLSLPNLWSGRWYNKVHLWRAEGLMQCLPIFSFAFGCQTQLFILYDALPEPSVKHVNSIVSSAVNMCAVAYLLVGFFGYVAMCDEEITGDIFTHFPLTIYSDGLKLCFVVSIAVTFPLIIFPCRSSLYTLMFPQKQKSKEDIMEGWSIPEVHFKVITAAIVLGSMIIGINVPNVEFVLAINGATTGTMMCFIFPALFYIRVMTSSDTKNSNVAKMVAIFGFAILFVSTYANIATQKKVHAHVMAQKNLMNPEENLGDELLPVVPKVSDIKELKKDPDDKADHRHEPPNPKEPESEALRKVEEEAREGKLTAKNDSIRNAKSGSKEEQSKNEIEAPKDEGLKEELEKKEQELLQKEKELEEKVKIEDEKLKEKEKETEEKQKVIIKQLEQQQVEQQKLLVEQKQILEELKQHKEEQHENKVVEGEINVPQQNLPLKVNSGQQQSAQQIGGQQNLPPQQIGEKANVPAQQIGGQQNLPPQQIGVQANVPSQQVGGQQNLPPQQIGGGTNLGSQQINQQKDQAANSYQGAIPVNDKNIVNPELQGQQQTVQQEVVKRDAAQLNSNQQEGLPLVDKSMDNQPIAAAQKTLNTEITNSRQKRDTMQKVASNNEMKMEGSLEKAAHSPVIDHLIDNILNSRNQDGGVKTI
ncbi:hypothetical protein ScPMuIL_004166 [Solemya velum]